MKLLQLKNIYVLEWGNINKATFYGILWPHVEGYKESEPSRTHLQARILIL